jgi:phosphate transport system substrate-binding protein
MSKSINKKMTFAVLLLAMLSLTTAISSVNAAPVLPDGLVNPPYELKVTGSSTVKPISDAADTAFEAFLGSPYVLTPASGGSGAGQTALKDGTADIAASSADPDAAFFAATGLADVRLFAVGKDGVAIIVPASNTWLTNLLDSRVVADIFRSDAKTSDTPMYANWNDVPGLAGLPGVPSTPISRYCRKMNDGTHECFNQYFMKPNGYDTGKTDGVTDWLPAHTTVNTNPDMISGVAGDANGIGYVGLGFLTANPTVRGLPINGVTPTKEHVLDNTYKNFQGATIARFLWYINNGIPTKASDGVIKSQWISFVRMHPEYTSSNGYINMVPGDFCGGIASADGTVNADGLLHDTLPDNKVNLDDITYFIDSYIAYWAQNKVNPYADTNADKAINLDDITNFIDAYIAYWT